MGYLLVIEHIREILKKCKGGTPLYIDYDREEETCLINNKWNVWLVETTILKKNDCFELPTPNPNPISDNMSYTINRIKIPKWISDDYGNDKPYTDDEMKLFIMKNQDLFGFF